MIWFAIIAITLLVGWLYFRFFKIPKLKNIVFVDGSLGTGKTFYCVSLAIRLYKRNLRAYHIALLLSKFGFKSEGLEKPILYSNIPLQGVYFQPLTLDVIERKVRVPHKSVILIDECSLLADQFDWKNAYVSDCLRDFVKLFRHLSHNGTLILNSQSVGDMHFAFKACITDYLYIHHKTKLPFFSALKVQEMIYSNDSGNAMNAFHSDIEDTLKTMLVPNKYFRKYDSLCYSVITDGLPYDDQEVYIEKGESLKCNDVVTFRKGKYQVKTKVVEVSKDDKAK